MELSKKTTILFPPELHERLVLLARQKKSSLGELVRRACRKQYGILSREDRQEAVSDLAALELPVDETSVMKQESVIRPEEIVP